MEASSFHYNSACKVGLQFNTRFWEHMKTPIFGDGSSSTIPVIGSTCCPSCQVSSARRDFSRLINITESSSCPLQMHGDLAYSEYSRTYDRRCWITDPMQAGNWASPLVGQHKLFTLAYYRTEKNFIFIGERTSFTHAWIASALESSVRGTV